MVDTLAVIGGGPKAAAIAAKASALSSVGYSPPEIHIFEHIRLGAAWRGKSGYTDGLQPVCTLAERDLGFPYDRHTFGVDVAQTMMSEFSWSAYAVRDGTDHTQYREWVLRGRQPPRHVDFAEYLERSIRLSGARHINGEVIALDYSAGLQPWRVVWEDGPSRKAMDFDGVVITGSGSPLPSLPNANGRVFDGKSFWTQIPQVWVLLQADQDPSVVIIGAGGTGAAIAHWFIQHFKRVPISIIGREPTLYTRHAGYFEDRLFTDEIAWSDLPAHMREVFVGRLTSGMSRIPT